MNKSNIVLIGMPSSGKTTLGRLLSERLGKEFLDTDAVIRGQDGRELQEIVLQDGLDRFLEIQQNTILNINVNNHVIATGGGVIYGKSAMEHLKENGCVIFLHEEFEHLKKRVDEGRRFARRDGQSLQELYEEREPLYRQYADITIECSGREAEEIAEEILRYVGE